MAITIDQGEVYTVLNPIYVNCGEAEIQREIETIREEYEAAINHAMDPETTPAQAIKFAQSAATRINDLAFAVRDERTPRA